MNRRLAAFCEVLDVMAEWMEAAGGYGPVEREALAATRSCIASGVPRAAERAYAAWLALDATHRGSPSPPPTGDFREALLLVCRGSISAPAEVTAATLNQAERILLTHAANVGAAAGVRDAGRAARVALEGGLRDGRKTSRFPEPGFARQAALGACLRLARSHARMDPAAVCAQAGRRGVRIAPAALTRYENGHHGRDAPTDVLAECVGLRGAELRARAELAHRMAQELAARHGVSDRERWFAEVVAVDDEDTARSYLAVCAAAAARVPSPDAVR